MISYIIISITFLLNVYNTNASPVCAYTISMYRNDIQSRRKIKSINQYKLENRLSIVPENPNVLETKNDEGAERFGDCNKCDVLYFSEVDCLSDPRLPRSPLKIFENDINFVNCSHKKKLAIETCYIFDDKMVEFVYTKIQKILVSEKIGYFPFLEIIQKKIDNKVIQNMLMKENVFLTDQDKIKVNNLKYSKLFYNIVMDVVKIEKQIRNIISSFIFLPHLIEFMLTYKSYFNIGLYEFMKFEDLANYKKKGYIDCEKIPIIVQDYNNLLQCFNKFLYDVENYDSVILAICMNNNLSYMLFCLINKTNNFNKTIIELKENYDLFKADIVKILFNNNNYNE